MNTKDKMKDMRVDFDSVLNLTNTQLKIKEANFV